MQPTGMKILACDDTEADAQLSAMAGALGVPREQLTIKPPAGWRGYGAAE